MFLTHSKIKRRNGFIQPLQALEKAHGSLQTTLKTARLLAQIQQDLNQFLQQELGMNCHVVRLDQEKLILAAPNNAIASKLRQFTPSIAQHLQQHGYHIQKLSIKIHAGLNALQKKTEVTTGRASCTSCQQQFKQAFAQLLAQEPNSPLAPTLKRLLQKD